MIEMLSKALFSLLVEIVKNIDRLHQFGIRWWREFLPQEFYNVEWQAGH